MDHSKTTSSKRVSFVFTNQLDQDFLASNYAANLELAKNIFKSFLENSSVELEKLKLEVTDENMEQIASISHKIKNNFLYIGAPNLNQFLIELEEAAKQNSNEVRKIYASFHVAFESLIPVIKKEVTRLDQYLKM